VLARWPHFGNLRVFQLGWTPDENYAEYPFSCHVDGERVHEWVKQMPNLEELYLFAHQVNGSKLFALPLPQLRVLQVYHSYDYALAKLAKNPTLTNLTHLLCHPHALDADEAYIRLDGLRQVVRSKTLTNLKHLRLRLADFGDEGCEEIIQSGVLQRLEVLDLRHGRIGDAGARALAACPELKRLKMLDVAHNEITSAGIAALEAVGIPLNTGHQREAGAESYPNEYLFQGDIE
jgi:Leucine Rich Repeat (LRR) protein